MNEAHEAKSMWPVIISQFCNRNLRSQTVNFAYHRKCFHKPQLQFEPFVVVIFPANFALETKLQLLISRLNQKFVKKHILWLSSSCFKVDQFEKGHSSLQDHLKYHFKKPWPVIMCCILKYVLKFSGSGKWMKEGLYVDLDVYRNWETIFWFICTILIL